MMKKVFSFVLLACMTLFVSACIEPVVENVPEEVTGGETVFSATLVNPSTKAELNEDNFGLHVLWSSKDKISLIYGGKTNFFLSDNSSPAATTSFTGTLQQVENLEDPYFYAIYPSHNNADKYETGGYITPQLNTTQAYANAGTFSFKDHTDGGVGTGPIFVGRSDTHTINFYNVCSFLRFKVTDNDDIIRVDFVGRSDEKICGPFKVGFNTDGTPTGLTVTDKTGKGPIKLSRENNLPFEKNQWYYLTLLPTYFEHGATITLYTETGSLARNIGGPLNFNMNECRSIASVDAGKTIPDDVTKKIQLNGKTISSTTLWPHGTAVLSLKLTGPSGNVIIPDSVTWSLPSEDETIATVVNNIVDGTVTGVVTGVSAREDPVIVTASATYKGKEYSKSCTVYVTDANNFTPTSFTVDNGGTKVNFASGNLYTPDGGTNYAFNSFQGQVRSIQPYWNVDGERDLLQWFEVATRTEQGEDIPIIRKLNNYSWQVLTLSQWTYLLKTRTASTINDKPNARYAKAIINGIPGLLLFPDDYSHPSNVTAIDNSSINVVNKDFSINVYYGSSWEKMEKAGVVFLPANNLYTGSSPREGGYYWASTTRDGNLENGHWVNFTPTSGSAISLSSTAKTSFLSVRLVRVVTTN